MARALVTGGTSGIGNEFAHQLAGRGYDLVLVARDTERLERVAAEIRDRFRVEVEVLTADLAVREDLLAVAERLGSTESPVDMLVNNAGFGLHGSLLDEDFSAAERALDVMCLAVLVLSAAAGRAMRPRGAGSIINVGSTSGLITAGTYSAVKAWVNVYTEGLAVELAGSGVLVTALLPGWVRTEFHQRAGINAARLPGVVWIDVEQVVRECLDDNAAGRVLSVPGRRWAAAAVLARLAPRRTIRWVSSALSRSRKRH
ncbi:MAG: SDR family NAD(P)-dependent oxidoreductase [Actinomycetia bacterium]|nr:SDR family NAD(P)-dependent oxidoreductase [Actinomycetes bacterium]